MIFAISALAGAVTGILTGFGVGGGTLLILYMQTFTSLSQSAAQGINLAYFLPTAGGSLIGHIKNRLVDKTAFLFSAGFGLVTTGVSAYLASGIDVNTARKIFGVFMLYVGISELFARKKGR